VSVSPTLLSKHPFVSVLFYTSTSACISAHLLVSLRSVVTACCNIASYKLHESNYDYDEHTLFVFVLSFPLFSLSLAFFTILVLPSPFAWIPFFINVASGVFLAENNSWLMADATALWAQRPVLLQKHDLEAAAPSDPAPGKHEQQEQQSSSRVLFSAAPLTDPPSASSPTFGKPSSRNRKRVSWFSSAKKASQKVKTK
jgi:hypothetical protein